jgi:vanillate monooxygenase ferredoxin subunit
MGGTWIDVVVAARHEATSRIVVLDLARPDGVGLPPYAAGAHVDVQLGLSPGLIRQYSLCGPPGDRSRYRLAVLAETESRGGSQAMHALKTGDRLQISEPRNRFGVSADARRHILVAGGIGVTPLLAMLMELESDGAEYELHYCSRTRADAAFLDDLERHPRASLHFDDGPDQQRFQVLRDLRQPDAGTVIYVCGPDGFMDFVIHEATEAGWSLDAIHKERFAPTEASNIESESSDFTIRLASNGAEYEVGENESVLDVLLENGVDAPHSCQQGICGECIVRVLAGEADHRDDVLTDRERADGLFTTCSSRALSPILELDL